MKNNLVGMFIGLAVGDALGRPIEGHDGRTVQGLEEGGPFHLDLPRGYWTDDTSMALCLADGLLAQGRYDSFDVMDRYLRWWKEGYRSALGHCFDIGNQVRQSIEDYAATPEIGEDAVRAPRGEGAGNGCIMRLAPVVVASLASGTSVGRLARISGRETHYSLEAENATEIFGEMLQRAVTAQRKEDVYPSARIDESIAWTIHGAAQQAPADLRPTGYVLDTLEVATWAFMTSSDFKTGALKAVNLGGDADTVGAVYGQLAGAYYGLTGIPADWRAQLHEYAELLSVAERLSDIDSLRPPVTRFAEDRRPSRIGAGAPLSPVSRYLEMAPEPHQSMSNPEQVSVEWHLSLADVERLRDGLHATEPEQKWEIRTVDDEVILTRSWTGTEIYRMPITADGAGHSVLGFTMDQTNRRQRISTQEARAELASLLRGLLGVEVRS